MRFFALRLALPSLVSDLNAGIRTRFRSAVLLAGLLLIAGSRTAAGAEPLIFGAFPNLPARQIVETYRPLANTLEKHLGRPVLVYSARDFKTFVERTHRGEYDILLTAPHLAWLARKEAGYQPLLKYTQPVRGLLVTHANSTVVDLNSLRGRTIAAPDPLAVVSLALQSELAQNGLRHGIDYQETESGTHINAVMQVINGRADAAMLGWHPYNLLPPEQRQQLRVIAETQPLSSLMYLTHPHLRNAESQSIRKALLEFAASSAGQAFMKHGGYGGLSNIEGDELQAFHPYALQAQEMLRAAR